MGQDATPANERRFSNDHLASVFEKTEAVAKQLDRFGWDTLWLAEHHFQHEGYEVLPEHPHDGRASGARDARRLRIGCGFNIAPMWHPLRLAEDFAIADILTKGRTVFGVGRGYHTARGGDLRRADASTRTPTANSSRSRSRSSSRRSTTSAFRTTASTTRCRRACPTAATRWKRSPWSRARCTGRWNAGSRSSAPARAGSISWSATASGAWWAAARRPWRKGPILGLSGGRGAGGAEPQARRESDDRHLLPPGQHARAGDPGDHPVLRGAREDVRPARLRAGDHAGAGGRGGPPGRLGRGGGADGGTLHEARRLVRRHPGAAHRAPAGHAGALPGLETSTSAPAWARRRL